MRKKLLAVLAAVTLVLSVLTPAASAAFGIFKVTFYPNYEGAESYTVNVGSGNSVGTDMPEDPQRMGYTFSGWYTEAECKNEFDSEMVITQDTDVFAAWKEFVPYYDTDDTVYDCEDYEIITAENCEFNCDEDTWLVFSDDCTELDRVILSGEVTYYLILKDGQTVSMAGIILEQGASLTVFGQAEGTGTLEAVSTDSLLPAIGNGKDENCGEIIINGGHIKAQASGAAAIGTGFTAEKYNKCEKIEINGGIVEAKSESGAGIGTACIGNMPTDCKKIIINGGYVKAESYSGAGIGSGDTSYYASKSCSIEINGGTVEATSHEGAGIGAGLGNGDRYSHFFSEVYSTVIRGGNITASSVNGAGIGSGNSTAGTSSNNYIEISGGNITTASVNGCGIGTGCPNPRSDSSSRCGKIIISGGTVLAKSENGSGIGSIKDNNKTQCRSLTINGGDVVSESKSTPAIFTFGDYDEDNSVGENFIVLSGTSEETAKYVPSLDMAASNYAHIYKIQSRSDDWYFSVNDETAFIAVNKETDEEFALILKTKDKVYDGTPVESFIDSDVMTWIFKTGVFPDAKFYLEDGQTLTDEQNSGAAYKGYAPKEPGNYCFRSEISINGKKLSLNKDFTIDKITPVIKNVKATDVESTHYITESIITADTDVQGSFSWVNPYQIINFLTYDSYEAIFTPRDTAHYKTVSLMIPVWYERTEAPITLSKSEISVQLDHSDDTVTYTYDGTNNYVDCYSKDSSVAVAVVDNANRKIIVTAKAIGETEIILDVEAEDPWLKPVPATLKVIVTPIELKIETSQSQIDVPVGTTDDTITYTYDGTNNYVDCMVSNANIAAAYVDNANRKIVITGKSAGEAEITVFAGGEGDEYEVISAVIKVNVTPQSSSLVKDVEFTPSKGAKNTYSIKVEDRANMVQLMELDHGDGTGTRSFDRYHDSVEIVSYDADGNVVPSTSKDLAYEIWTITTQLADGNIGVRVKEAGSPAWEDASDAYVFENTYEEVDSEVVSASLAKTEGSKGAVKATVVTGADAQIVQLKNKEGETFTFDLSKATENEDGTLTFNCAVYFHGTSGTVNTAEIRVNDVYGWHDSDVTVEYIIL